MIVVKISMMYRNIIMSMELEWMSNYGKNKVTLKKRKVGKCKENIFRILVKSAPYLLVFRVGCDVLFRKCVRRARSCPYPVFSLDKSLGLGMEYVCKDKMRCKML